MDYLYAFDGGSGDWLADAIASLTANDILLGLAAGVLVGVGFFVFRLIQEQRDRIAKQKQSLVRDQLALQVGACLSDGKSPPAFALYLRPFKSTGYQYLVAAAGAGLAATIATTAIAYASPVVRVGSNIFRGQLLPAGRILGRFLLLLMIVLVSAFVVDFLLWRTYLFFKRRSLIANAKKLAKDPRVERGEVLADFEDILEDGLHKSKKLDLIGLGNPGESIGGAGRLRVPDEEWKKYIEFLMQRSSFNILVLSPRPGTLWEIEQTLSTDAWKKTLFVQPPVGGVSKGAYAPDADYDAVREVFSKYGATIPVRQVRGVAFAFSDLTSVPRAWQGMETADTIAKACKIVGNESPIDALLGPPPKPEAPILGLPSVDLDRPRALTSR